MKKSPEIISGRMTFGETITPELMQTEPIQYMLHATVYAHPYLFFHYHKYIPCPFPQGTQGDFQFNTKTSRKPEVSNTNV